MQSPQHGSGLKFRKREEIDPMKTTALDKGTASRTGKPGTAAAQCLKLCSVCKPPATMRTVT